MPTILRNNARCGIIIPFVGQDIDGLVAPGCEITAPDEAMETDFVKNLINIGELINLGSVEDGELTIEQLRAKCDELGIEHSPRWSKATLKAAIEKA